nr:AAA family ATPase [Lachnospiraceae bacterium]
MGYLKRKIDIFLEEWRQDTHRKPLVIKGPRQIGKTESVRKFGAEHYNNVIEINFVEEPKYKQIIADGYKTSDLIRNISRIDPAKRFTEGETLLFFDELQEFPEIATALKFFEQDGRFDVICSGSLLGIHYGRIESNSVGYKTDYEMHSLDFEEFLWAKGYDSVFVEDLFAHMKQLYPFNETELSVCNALFLDFCILGGMPAVVREYIERDSFEGSLEIQ